MRILGAVLIMIGGVALGVAEGGAYDSSTIPRCIIGLAAIVAGTTVVMVAK